MPDIAMCANSICPLRKGCYRHEESGAVPTPRRQAYSAYTVFFDADTDRIHCPGYSPLGDPDPRWVDVDAITSLLPKEPS